MFFKLQPIVYSLIFVIALEILVMRDDFVFWVVIFLISFSFVIIWPIARKLRFLAIPLFLSLGSVSLLYLIDYKLERQVFIGLSFVVYYLAVLGAYRLKMYRYDTTAQGMVNLATLVTAFFWFSSNIGWFLNFQIQSWILVLTFFGSTFLISFSSLSVATNKKEEENDGNNNLFIHQGTVLFLGIILSTIMSQWAWGIALWPFSYLTTGAITMVLFYFFWDIIRIYLKQEFTVERVLTNTFLSLLLLTGILMTTEWNLSV
jgi:hypothetical protein